MSEATSRLQTPKAPVFSFKPRKRGKLSRRRSTTSASSKIPDAKERKALRELLVARGLREEVRENRLSGSKGKVAAEDGQEDVIGLGGKFSGEKGGAAVEQAMEDFIEKGMREKFGDSVNSGSMKGEKTGEMNLKTTAVMRGGETKAVEYEIPKRLRVEQKKQYDPSEAVPLGIEEVRL